MKKRERIYEKNSSGTRRRKKELVKMKKRLFSMLLALSLIMSLLPGTAWADTSTASEQTTEITSKKSSRPPAPPVGPTYQHGVDVISPDNTEDPVESDTESDPEENPDPDPFGSNPSGKPGGTPYVPPEDEDDEPEPVPEPEPEPEPPEPEPKPEPPEPEEPKPVPPEPPEPDHDDDSDDDDDEPTRTSVSPTPSAIWADKPSPIQTAILKDESEIADWIDRLKLPEYAEKLYEVISGHPADSPTGTWAPGSIFEDELNFTVSRETPVGSEITADVESIEIVEFSIRDMYANGTNEPKIDSTLFADERFYTISANDADKNVNYPDLKPGDMVKTANFNGVFVTKIAKDSSFDAKKKEACEYTAAVYHAFDIDNPEIFWLSGKCKVRILTVTDPATKTPESYFFLVLADKDGFTMRSPAWTEAGSIEAGIQRRDKAVDTILATVTSGEVQGQVKQLNQWLTEHNQYNTTPNLTTIGNEPHECLSALEGRIDTAGPVCDGYARAFKVLCDRLDIPCVLETGWARPIKNGTAEFHMWSNVQVGKIWYGVDITWDDPSVKGFIGAKSGRENENYLLVGSDTVIHEQPFDVSHVVKDQLAEGGVEFDNGPVLSATAFSATPYSGGYYVSLFDDISEDHLAAEAAAWAKSMGYMVGTSDTTFSPDGELTREQIWMVLARLSGENPVDFQAAHDWAMQTELSDGSNPQEVASRQELLTMLYRYAKMQGDPTDGLDDLSAYRDANEISPLVADAMKWAVGNGVITGTSATTLSPNAKTSRAQFALILQNYCKNIHTEH